MGFPLSDLRRTVRRSRDGDSIVLYPKLLVGAAPLPKIAVAVRYFESMLGKRRGDMQPGVLVEFFADAKLARCVVACLTRAYRYRVRTFEEVIGVDAAARLAAAGLRGPRELRLRLFGLANALHDGFLPPSERAELLRPQLEQWGITSEQLDELLMLDAEDQQVLERFTKSAPEPSDVAALYNYQTIDTALRAASRVAVDAKAFDRAAVKRFAALLRRHGVAGRVERHGGTVRFVVYGRQDALGSWTRHGGRVVRVLARLLAITSTCDGMATVELNGKPHELRLDDHLLEILGAGWADDAGADVEPLDDGLEVEFRREFAELRRQGLADGWMIRRDPDPVILDRCVFLPDLALAARGRRVFLAIATTPHAALSLGETLRLVSGKAPVVALVAAGVRENLGDVGLPVLTFEERLPAFELVALLRSGISLYDETPAEQADDASRCA